ncbi:MAG TPA: hypothetical protein PLS03_14145 [Terrimicrobiaceae bacterium]|nr:hypothetical protein [Terrimicrobiaceae bacterium]
MSTPKQPGNEAAAGHESQVPKGGDSVDCLVQPCHDCGKPSTGRLLMNIHVAGDFQYLCADCQEENDPDGVMQEPCSRCHGSGIEWEGWNCEQCDGSGTDDF